MQLKELTVKLETMDRDTVLQTEPIPTIENGHQPEEELNQMNGDFIFNGFVNGELQILPRSASEPSSQIDSAAKRPPVQNPSMDEVRAFLFETLGGYGEELNRMKWRYDQLKEFCIRMFGTGDDGSISTPFDAHAHNLMGRYGYEHMPPIIRDPRVYFDHRGIPPLFDREEGRLTRKRQSESQFNRSREIKRHRSMPYANRSERRDDGDENGKPHEEEGLKFNYMRQDEEEDYFNDSKDVFEYAIKIAKVLFVTNPGRPYKEQSSRRRGWLRQALKIRFPQPDPEAQLAQWFEVKEAVNKALTQPRREKKREINGQSSHIAPNRISNAPVVVTDAGLDFSSNYISPENEQRCFDEADGDAFKYAELVGFKLFRATLFKFFSEQDPDRKEFLRDCINKRYPLENSVEASTRWRICAAYVNKNRFKVATADENKPTPAAFATAHSTPKAPLSNIVKATARSELTDTPYFLTEEEEQKCWDESDGSIPRYSEIVAKMLFKDAPHIPFKSQHPEQRAWLKQQIDTRFPSDDQMQRDNKWKRCRTTINRMNMYSDLDMPDAASSPEPSPIVVNHRSESRNSTTSSNPVSVGRKSASSSAAAIAEANRSRSRRLNEDFELSWTPPIPFDRSIAVAKREKYAAAMEAAAAAKIASKAAASPTTPNVVPETVTTTTPPVSTNKENGTTVEKNGVRTPSGRYAPKVNGDKAPTTPTVTTRKRAE